MTTTTKAATRKMSDVFKDELEWVPQARVFRLMSDVFSIRFAALKKLIKHGAFPSPIQLGDGKKFIYRRADVMAALDAMEAKAEAQARAKA